MVKIPDFQSRLNFYSRRAHLIPSHFIKGQEINQHSIAALIPADPSVRVPAVAEEVDRAGRELVDNPREPIRPQAIGNWLRGNALPNSRRRQWKDLTGMPVAIWADEDEAGFERGTRRLAGELLGWHGMVREKGKRNAMRVQPFNPPERDSSPTFGLLPAAVNIGEPPDKQLVWPGCRARVHVPVSPSRAESDERRAWMISDYSPNLFVIDPSVAADGTAPSSRLPRIVTARTGGGSHVTLPRGTKDYVWIPPRMKLGLRFEVTVIVFDLRRQPQEVRTVIDTLERRWLVKPTEVLSRRYQETVRAALDEAASLIDERKIPYCIYRQECEVVDAATARDGG